ncbi:MAG TPA: hypothetical protein VEV43_15680, partial [Actinomycetota bacterium]|nr:hypothetical protein [Actinomycetota bacterium]
AWSWGAGDTGSNHQAPPETEFEDVCQVAPKAAPPPEKARPKRAGTGEKKGAQPPAPFAAEPEPGDAERPADPRKRRPQSRPRVREGHGRHVDPAAPQPSPLPSEPVSVAAEPASDESGDGPPVTGLVGLAAAGALGAVAWRGSRRKKV